MRWVPPLRECGGMPNRERQAWRADDGRGAPPLCAGAWRKAGVYALPPAPGRNVGRAISPAAWGLRRCKVSGTMQASSPTDAGQGSAGLCRISPAQSGNAPLRLRLTAQPPSGLRYPHRTARAEARLCSATVKPAPSRFLRRRRRSTPQPLAGEALSSACRLKGSPVRGAGGVSQLRGAVPCPANILPGWPPRRAISPALHCKANGRHNRGRQTVPRRRAAFRTDRPLRPLRRGR